MKNKLLAFFLFALAVASFVMFFISRNNQEYIVTFDSNGGSFVEMQKIKYHQRVNKPVDPVRDNYEFLGWQNSGVLYDFNKEIEGNLLLTASWKEKNSYRVVITLEGVGYESIIYENNVIDIEKYTFPKMKHY